MATKIEWTGETWNPVTGCTQLSAGCKNCYAKTIALQMQKNGVRKYANGFTVTMHEYALNMPRLLHEPSFIFVCSMADLFHKDVPFEFIDKVMDVIRSTPWHTYQILTKRAEFECSYLVLLAVFQFEEQTDNFPIHSSLERNTIIRNQLPHERIGNIAGSHRRHGLQTVRNPREQA